MVTRVEESAFEDVSSLIIEARGEGPADGRSAVQLILGRWDTAPLLRRLGDDTTLDDCNRLHPDEIYLRVIPDEDPPTALTIGGSPARRATRPTRSWRRSSGSASSWSGTRSLT